MRKYDQGIDSLIRGGLSQRHWQGPAFAKRANHFREDPALGYWVYNNVKCVERSFSVGVGNPAVKNRFAFWPAPCGRAWQSFRPDFDEGGTLMRACLWKIAVALALFGIV